MRTPVQTRAVVMAVLIASLIIAPLWSPHVLAADSPIPDYAWTRGIGEPFPGAGKPKTDYPIIDDGAMQGAPLGGLGAGTFSRTLAGDFARWHLNIGAHEYRSIPANMFSVYTATGDGKQGTAQALYTGAPADKSLSGWKWRYPVGAGTYWALYPKSGFVYTGLPIALSVEQFSPILPNNYKESSYPVAVFNYTAQNPGTSPIKVGLMFTWENMLSPDLGKTARSGLTARVRDEGDLRGVQFGRSTPFAGDEWDGSTAIAAQKTPGVTLGTFAGFNPAGDGAAIWRDFQADGSLDDKRDAAPATQNQRLAAGVSASFTLEPGQSMTVPFFLAWDQPVMSFGTAAKPGGDWYKRYTAFYGHDGAQAWSIVQDAAKHQAEWSAAIRAWQAPILADPARPAWYKTALFNELYYLADGGTAWEHGAVEKNKSQFGLIGQPSSRSPDQLGRFLTLEGFDYQFYATFDVDYYASFALLKLWPELEARVVDDFAATVPTEDTTGGHLIKGKFIARKLAGGVPHDLGGPTESPWYQINLYNISPYTLTDVNRWKDLNPKFVLRLYRDAVLLKKPEIAVSRYAEVKQAMAHVATFDQDGDGIPENEGVPDQTYDTWPVTGVSAYSGGLWLAALRAASEIATLANDPAMAAQYSAQLEKAQAVYEKKLWTGRYYAYDSSNSPTHDSIMADQFAGQWYLDYTGQRVLPEANIGQGLRTIFEYNVSKFGDGTLGAVNGMRPDGKIDTSSEQSQEVWTGVTYGVAAVMLNHGLTDEAWKTAYGVYNVTYQKYGYWFRTPEAYILTGGFRASMYMRPLSIWAMEFSLAQQTKK